MEPYIKQSVSKVPRVAIIYRFYSSIFGLYCDLLYFVFYIFVDMQKLEMQTMEITNVLLFAIASW